MREYKGYRWRIFSRVEYAKGVCVVVFKKIEDTDWYYAEILNTSMAETGPWRIKESIRRCIEKLIEKESELETKD